MDDQVQPDSSALQVHKPKKGNGDFEFDPRALIPVPIVFCDANGWILWLNTASESLTGFRAHDLMGKAFVELFPKSDRSLTVGRILRWYRKGSEQLYMEVPINTANEKPHWVGLQVRRIWTPNGKNIFVCSFNDLHEMHEQVETLKKQVSELEARVEESSAAVQLKSEFVHAISEDIRTPMSGVIGMSRMLLESELSPEQQTVVEVIENSGQQLLQVVDDILDFTRIEAGDFDTKTLEFDLKVTLESVVAALGNRAENNGIKFTYAVEENVPCHLKGDPGRFRQVILNLGKQMIEHSTGGKMCLRVRRIDETARGVVLEVVLSGSDISTSNESTTVLFEAFARKDASLLQGLGSPGLGIGLSRQILALLRGEPQGRQETDPLGIFRFNIPFEKQEEPKVLGDLNSMDLKGNRLLVAEPVEANAEWLAKEAETWGCQTTIVGSGTQAISELERAAQADLGIHLAIIDYDLPDLDVDSIAECVREQPGSNETVLMMITSMGRRGDAERARKLGYVAYLPKPLSSEELRAAVALSLWQSKQSSLSNAESPPDLITRHRLAELRHSNSSSTESREEPTQPQDEERGLPVCYQ